MAWGGGGGMGGGGGGGMGGMSGAAIGAIRRAMPGLPFAGVPPEMRAAVESITAREPAFELDDVDFTQVDDQRTRFTLRTFLRPQRTAIALVLVLVVAETILLQLGPRLSQLAIDRGVIPGRFGVLATLAMLYVGSVVVAAVISGLRTAWSGRIAENLLYRLRVRIFAHIQRLSLDFFTDEKAGRIMTRVTSDVEALQVLFQQGLVNMVIQAGTLVFVITQLFSMNATLAFWVTFGILPVLTVATLWFRTASGIGYLAVRDRTALVLSDLQENLSGNRVVTAYNRQRFNSVKHANIVGDYRAANLYTAHIGAFYGSSATFLGVAAQACVLFLGGRMMLRGELSLGELTAFVLYLNSFFLPVQQLVQLYNTYQQGRAALIKLRELFETSPSVLERPDAVELPPLEGEIRLEGVTFGYAPERPVLVDVDLVVERGETFALVGPTGAGKSTIAKLLSRFYDPQQGRVLVDGHDVRDVTFASLRRQLGVVPQEPFLFAGTIADNIAFAQPDVTRDDIVEACRAVGILDAIEAKPKGLDTPCHERGVTLSSGERQLIAIARAFLTSPRVLILDEATSSLDLATEALIERALDILLEGRTAILIAHRLNTAMRADRIGVVEDGRIVEVGSHDELVARGGRYAAMYEAWARHGEDPAEGPAEA